MRFVLCLPLLLVACAQSGPPAQESPEPESPPGSGETLTEGDLAGGATHRGRVLPPIGPEAEALAKGATWTNTVTVTVTGTTASFTWTVNRTGAENAADASWSGTTTVPNGNSTTLTFPGDSAGLHDHYALDLTAGD